MHVIVWTYSVPPGCEDAFIAAYGPDGDWARLFAQAAGFLGVELLGGEGGVFITLDRWDSAAALAAFQNRFADAYGELDARLAHLSRAQTRVGAFSSV